MRVDIEPSRFDNLFTFIWRNASKKHLSLLDYHVKLSHCYVDVTEANVRLHTSLVQIL